MSKTMSPEEVDLFAAELYGNGMENVVLSLARWLSDMHKASGGRVDTAYSSVLHKLQELLDEEKTRVEHL